MKLKLIASSILISATLIFTGFIIQDDEKLSLLNNYEIIGVRVSDTDGNFHRIGIENKRAFPVIIVFIDVGCVVSQRMIPHLNELFLKSQELNTKFYGIISNPKVQWTEAQKFKDEFDIQFPLLFDANGDLAQRLNPRVVPESYVFDINDALIYKGRVNDQFAEVGKMNRAIRNTDLLNAIIAASKGETVLVKNQKAIGCIFEPWDLEKNTITYNKHIEPLIRANCTNCHKPKDIAPFSLLNYEDVSKRSRMVEYVTKKRFMPIWKGKKGYGKFSNEHTLSDYQINLIKKWVRTGKKEGEEKDKMPDIKKSVTEWKLGKPDLILKMEPYDLPASGDDQYRVLVMKDAIPKGKIIRALDFKPGDPAVVHHSTIFIDYSKKLRKYDAEDPEAGYDAFEKGGTMEFGSAVTIGNWAPGIGPYSYPENVGFYVESNADIAFENHYHLSGKATTDQSYIGIYFADKQPEKYITGSIMGTQKLQIPANESNFSKTVWTYVPVDIELFDITPHMHYIGKEVKVDITFPDGSQKPLLYLEDWDLRWQNVYTLRNLLSIPKGSIISASFTYDNSENNHDNPNYPPKEMYWGWGSNDEMCEIYFSYIPKKTTDYGKMLTSSFASFEHFYDAKDRINITTTNLNQVANDYLNSDIWSENGQKLLISIIESGLSKDILDKIEEELKPKKENTIYKLNVGHLRYSYTFFSGKEKDIIEQGNKYANLLYGIRSKDKSNWNASYAYGKLLMDSGESKSEKEALRVLSELVLKQEKLNSKNKYAKVYWELGKYYYKNNQDDKAEEILKKGIQLHPRNKDLKQELASGGRIVKKKLN